MCMPRNAQHHAMLIAAMACGVVDKCTTGMQQLLSLPPWLYLVTTGVLKHQQVQSLRVWLANVVLDDIKQLAAMPSMQQLHLGLLMRNAEQCATQLQGLQGVTKLKSLEIIGGAVDKLGFKALATLTHLTSLMILTPHTEKGSVLNHCLYELPELRHLTVRVPDYVARGNSFDRGSLRISMCFVACSHLFWVGCGGAYCRVQVRV